LKADFLSLTTSNEPNLLNIPVSCKHWLKCNTVSTRWYRSNHMWVFLALWRRIKIRMFITVVWNNTTCNLVVRQQWLNRNWLPANSNSGNRKFLKNSSKYFRKKCIYLHIHVCACVRVCAVCVCVLGCEMQSPVVIAVFSVRSIYVCDLILPKKHKKLTTKSCHLTISWTLTFSYYKNVSLHAALYNRHMFESLQYTFEDHDENI
jgi:hypothetical protein